MSMPIDLCAVASFCWDGPLETSPDGSPRVEAVNFVPNRELVIYGFFE